MSDNPADVLRRRDTIKVPAVLVPAGQDPGPALRGLISNPVRLPVRMQPRGGAGQPGHAAGRGAGQTGSDQTGSDQTGSDQTGDRQPAFSAPAAGQSGDANIPTGPSGIPSAAPRRLAPVPAGGGRVPADPGGAGFGPDPGRIARTPGLLAPGSGSPDTAEPEPEERAPGQPPSPAG